MIREKYILDCVKNKDVLDIGSVGQTNTYNLWNLISKEAKSLTGIDTEKSDNPNIVLGNMEEYSFDRKFDVIIAGDVLEHVNNQGIFLNNIYKHLKEDGLLIITTPNAKWLTVILKPNPTHTLWHDKYTLFYILKINNFKIKYFRFYCGNKPYYNFIKKLLAWRQGLLVICEKK